MESACSIIIPTYNRCEYLKFCLENIKKYTDIAYDLIVINNGSTDATLNFLNNLKLPNVVIINNAKNYGVAKALLQGEELAKTKYLLMMDDDVVVSPHWLENLIKIYEKYPKVKLLGPIKPSSRLIHPYIRGNSRFLLERISENNLKASPRELLNEYCVGHSYEELVRDFKKLNACGDVVLEVPPEILGGCCVLTERNFIKKVGGCADDLFSMYGSEDADRSWRVAEAGFKVMRTGKVYIHHFEVKFPKQVVKKQKNIRKNNKRFIKKWSNEFWRIIAMKKRKGFSLEDIADRYWFLREILKNLDEENVPKSFKGDYFKYKEKSDL